MFLDEIQVIFTQMFNPIWTGLLIFTCLLGVGIVFRGMHVW